MKASDRVGVPLELLGGEQFPAEREFTRKVAFAAQRRTLACHGEWYFELCGVLVRDDPRHKLADHVHQRWNMHGGAPMIGQTPKGSCPTAVSHGDERKTSGLFGKDIEGLWDHD